MVKRLCQQLEFKAVHVAFDNFFSSPSLMKDLTAKKIYSTGTVSANRRAATSCKTEVKKGAWRNELKKPRQLRVCTVYGHKTYVLSTAFAATEIVTVNRRQKDGSIEVINCPRLVTEYTARMGGVDRFDQKTGCYSVSRRSKR